MPRLDSPEYRRVWPQSLSADKISPRCYGLPLHGYMALSILVQKEQDPDLPSRLYFPSYCTIMKHGQ